TVAFQSLHDARVQRQQPFLTKLALPDMKHAGFGIEIGRVETESFADPKSGHSDQTEERRAGQAAHAVDRWQRPRMLDDRNDFGFTINIWMHTLNATGHPSPGRGLVLGVYAMQPFGKLAGYPEACCPGSWTGRGQAFKPAHD